MDDDDSDRLDGCDLVGPVSKADPWEDYELDGLVLFADMDPTDLRAVDRRMVEWRELFGSPHA